MFKLLITRKGSLGSGGGFRAHYDWQITCTNRLYCLACGLFWGWPCKQRYRDTRVGFCSINTASVSYEWRCAYLFFHWDPRLRHHRKKWTPNKVEFFSNCRTSTLTSSRPALLVRLAWGDNPKFHCASLSLLSLTTWNTLDGHLLTFTYSWAFQASPQPFFGGVPP